MGENLRPYSNEGRKRGLRIRMEVTHVSFGGHQSPPCNITEAHFSFFLVITLPVQKLFLRERFFDKAFSTCSLECVFMLVLLPQ